MDRMIPVVATVAAALIVLGAAGDAHAYVGPGAGLTLLGALWAVVLAVVISLGAILLWPIRVLRRKLREKKAPEATDKTDGDSPDAP